MRLVLFLRILGLIILDILAIFWLLKILEPVAYWYLNTSPSVGVDLYNSATYVAYHLKNFSLPFNSFKDIWFGGYPLMKDFPQLSFYLMTPFGAIFGPQRGVLVFTVASLFLLLVSSYLLFFKLSKNFGLSIFLTTLVLLSPNIYGSATWAGSIPYFTSQIFFPLGLLFGAKYLDQPNGKNLALMILVTGLGILLHPLGIITFLIPSLAIIILASSLTATFSLGRIIKHLFLYIAGFILVSFSFTHDYVTTFFGLRAISSVVTPTIPGGGQQGGSPTDEAIAAFYRNIIARLFTDTHNWFFITLAVGFVLFLFALSFFRHKKKALIALPFILIAGYTALHPAVNFAGILQFMRHQPYRAFWPFPIAMGALTAVFWGYLLSFLDGLLREKRSFLKIGANILLALVVTLGFVFYSFQVYKNDVHKVIERIISTSELSSAFPEALSINLAKEELEGLKRQIIPKFIDPSDKNKRLYTADAAVNIWWNSFFDMPLARGYIDPPIGTHQRGGFFWLDIAIANDTIVRDFKISEDQALANTLFLIDWYGIYYFEGGRLGSKGPSAPPSSYLLKNNVFEKEEETITHGAVLKYETPSGKPELRLELPQILKFYKIADKFTSPILAPTNASAVLVFTDLPGYEDIMRILGAFNLNSKKLIPVYGGKFIDKLSADELKNFDAVILHQYSYRNKGKAFGLLENYVKDGGKLFVDTGGEVKESNNGNLPEFFPFQASVRKGYGKSWDFSTEPNKLTEGIDFSKFGPPIFNQDEWKLSTSQEGVELRENSQVLLKHGTKPLLIERKIGEGQVVWSGLNLFYHFNQFKSIEEAKLFRNILAQFTSLDEREVIPAKAEWVKSEKVYISTDQKIRGILFKEQGYDGWVAKLNSEGGKKLPIYLVGPTYPGFMYVPLEKLTSGSVKVQFTYLGTPLYWFAALINLVTVLLILEFVIFNGRFIGKRINVIWEKLRRNVSFWWEKEEE